MIPSVFTMGSDRKVFDKHCFGQGHSTLWDRNQNFPVLLPLMFFTFYLFVGHSSSKPDVISQLEREEKLCTKEFHTQGGRHSAKNHVAGVLIGGSVVCLCSG